MIPSPKTTILMYGRTRAGKSTQIGELAELVMTRSGKKTRLYSADKGGFDSIAPYVALGVIEVVEQGDSDPWIFLNKASHGYVRDSAGKWVLGDNTNIGVYAFESMTAFADAMMNDLAVRAAAGINVGGAANISFSVTGDGESVKIGGSNPAHYNVVQSRITEEVWQSFRLPGEYIVWTASASKDDDQSASGKVVGPAVTGRALTAEVPRWFKLTFRLDALPAQQGKPERHVLYLGNHIDTSTGGAVGLGNTRTPLDAPPFKDNIIEPASIKKALEQIQGGQDAATDIIRKRLGIVINQQAGQLATKTAK